MSNLKFSFNSIPFQAVTITNSGDELEDHPLINTFDSKRHCWFRADTAGTSITFTYDLGSATTLTADHFIMARADRFQDDSGSQVRLRHSPDNAVWTTVFDNTTFASETLTGPNSQDYVNTFTETVSRRYWEVRLTASSSSKFTVSKIVFGKWFTFDFDLDSYTSEFLPATEPFISADGSVYYGKSYDDVRRYTLTWKGVTDTQVKEINEQLLGPERLGGFIYADAETNVLDEHDLIHYEVEDYQVVKTWNNWNDLTLILREAVG